VAILTALGRRCSLTPVAPWTTRCTAYRRAQRGRRTGLVRRRIGRWAAVATG
jgi:hypothetical protein